MERDLDLKPGLKIAGCVGLIVALLVFAGPYIVYVLAWGFSGTFSNLETLGPVDFHGKVVDPQGNGIPGVTLTATIRSYRVIGGYFERETKFETDLNGGFRIKARKANALILYDFSKSGFSIRGRPEQRGQRVELVDFWPFRVNPYNNPNLPVTDELNPFTFVMEQTDGPNKSAHSTRHSLGVD
ncbi:MAG: carboxypeptidase-like regulatory domain-containing protein [Verrucomicrobiales bacterium]|nr:carboxypeptidase-like regulatory domain-containing protein [Verrucomicrobiales bacterium]